VSSIYGILGLWTGCYECNNFFDFFKLFENVDMDGGFPMRRYTSRLDSWFKSYEVFKISAQVGACCQPLSMQQNLPKFAQNCPKLPKFAKICPKTISLRNFGMPLKIEILVFFKNKNFYM
jgi:hypothetical protein